MWFASGRLQLLRNIKVLVDILTDSLKILSVMVNIIYKLPVSRTCVKCSLNIMAVVCDSRCFLF